MKTISKFTASFLVAALAACGGEPGLPPVDETVQRLPPVDEIVQLELNQSKWEAHGIDSYQVEYQSGIVFQGPFVTRIKVLTVAEGMISKAVVKETGVEIPEEEYSENYNNIMTIDEAFLLIESLIQQNPDKLTVEYDEEFGFPESIYVDYRLMTYDEEDSWNFTAFTPTP